MPVISQAARLLFVAGILLVSGCIMPGTGIEIPFIPDFFGPDTKSYENDVIIIDSITAIPPEIAPGQRTKILIYVKNRIAKEIKDVNVELFDYCQGSLKLADSASQEQAIDRLLGGEIREVSWDLEAEEGIKLVNTCTKDGVKVRAKYKFTTPSTTTISFIDEVEMQRRREAGSFRNIQSNIVLGEGPLKPILTVEDAQPVSTGSKITVIALQIENKGSGFVKDSKVPTSSIQFESKGFPSLASQMKACIDKLEAKELKLIQRKTPKIPCKIDIPAEVAGKIESSDTISVTVADYDYEFRNNALVTVRPKL